MSEARTQGGWLSLTMAAAAAIIVGFASTILVVMEAARTMGANAAQQASAASALCLAMAAGSLVLSVRYRQPIMVAWSVPGAALLATSGGGFTWPEAVGAFVLAGVLMVLTSFIGPLARAINRLPPALAAALLAGVLLRYVLGVPAAALASPLFVFPLVAVYFVLRLLLPLYAVPVMVGLGLVMAAFTGGVHTASPVGLTPLVFVWPQWTWQALLGLGVPLYLVTMASQNLPGFAVLRAHGYQPPVSASLLVTGALSTLTAPFGTHAVNLAAITAAIVAGPECHPDPAQRWKMVFPYSLLYALVGLAAGTFVSVLGALPKDLVTAIAGLALFAPLSGGMVAMAKDPHDVEAALITFLVTASGITLWGVGSAFWGLAAGLVMWAAKHALWRP